MDVDEKVPEPVAVTKECVRVVASNDAQTLQQYGIERRDDGLVYWRQDCASHPRNWSTRRKVFDTTVIILFEFYT